ncbi:MFS general substrate transporter [Ramicandelaber brevisporus]|nr:MFS general substrate transporter [Ramicandelaber brevisporus]
MTVAVAATAASKKLVRQLDWRLLPLLSLTYMLAYLDRVNIGNARVYGMRTDLSMSDAAFSWALSILFFGYILFEVPANLILRRMRPATWFSMICLAWGILSSLLAACHQTWQVLLLRFLLGIAEAGLYPGVCLYLTYWYTKREQALRIGLFGTFAQLAGAFGGLIAYGIHNLDGHGGLASWRWLFLIEGLPSIAFAFLLYWTLPDPPLPEISESSWMTNDDAILVVERLRADSTDPLEAHRRMVSRSQLQHALRDVHLYLGMLCAFCMISAVYSQAYFMPSIIAGFNYSPVTAQLLSAPPYILGMIGTLIWTWNSDRLHERGFHVAASAFMTCICYVLLACTQGTGRYAIIMIMMLSIGSGVPVLVTWMANNSKGATNVAAATAMTIGFGNVGGILAGQMYKSVEAPRYIKSHVVIASLLFVGGCVALLVRFLYARANRKILEERKRAQEQGLEPSNEKLYVL